MELLHAGDWPVGVAVDGGEGVTVRHENVFVLSGFAPRHHDLSFDGDQIVVMSGRKVVADGQLPPGDGERRGRRLDLGIPDFAARQGQESIVHIGKTRSVGQIADAQRAKGKGPDPQAPDSILEYHCRAGLIVGDCPFP